MAVDFTSAYVTIDQLTEDWQEQVIDAMTAYDSTDNDVTQAGAEDIEDAIEANGNVSGQEIQSLNDDGYVYANGEVITVDGSAFLYVNEQINTQLTNAASGLSSAAKMNEKISNTIKQKLA